MPEPSFPKRTLAHEPFNPRLAGKLQGLFRITLGTQPGSADDVDGERMPEGAIEAMRKDPESGGRMPDERRAFSLWWGSDKKKHD